MTSKNFRYEKPTQLRIQTTKSKKKLKKQNAPERVQLCDTNSDKCGTNDSEQSTTRWFPPTKTEVTTSKNHEKTRKT